MKTLFFILMVIFLGCKDSTKQETINVNKDTIVKETTVKDSSLKNHYVSLPKSKADRIKYHTNKDTVIIYSGFNDTLKYAKNDFNDIVDNFPELYDPTIYSPDTLYSKSRIWIELKDSLGNNKTTTFSSECGQDEYYTLYAYFLKHKNGIAKFSIRRKKLLEIYRTLNSLFGSLNYGGTYFGHQYSRIEGYAEFSVYWFHHYEDYFDRPYDITKQKELYIAGLKQLISDEMKIDYNIVQKEQKMTRRKE